MREQIIKSLSSALSEAKIFASKRIPNIQETLVTSITQSTIDTFVGKIKLLFGDNPTAPAIFRDISKAPSVYANVYQNNTIGYTETKYDEGTIYSHGIKILCKSVILSGYKYTYLAQGMDFIQVARTANYICEIPNRYLNIMVKEKQIEEKLYIDQPKKSFWEFVFNNSNPSIWMEATGEALVKTTISDQLGEVVKYAGYVKLIRETAVVIDNYILNSFGGSTTPFSQENDIYSKGFITFTNFGISYKTPVVFALTTVVDWTAKVITEIVNAYVLGFPTRVCQDSTGKVIGLLYNEILSNNTNQTQENFSELKVSLDDLDQKCIGNTESFFNDTNLE